MLPAYGSVCLVDHQKGDTTAAVTCTSVAQALKHGVVTASIAEKTSIFSRARRFIVGVVPNHVSKVRVKTSGDGSAVVRVVRNTFVLRDSVSRPPESVELLRGQ